MIITIKNLQQQTFTVELDADKTVFELKEAIFKNRGGGEYCVEKQKLIYAGVILEDDRKLNSYNVDEKKFVVVMLKRSAETNKSTTTTTNAPQQSEEAAVKVETEAKPEDKENAGGDDASTKTSDNSNSQSSNLPEAPLRSQAESNLLMGEEYNRSVESMIEMGYSRDMVERAMAASYNNPERAVEYLISGIPDAADIGFEAEQEAGNARIDESRNRRAASINTTTSARNDPFEFLRDQPQFLQMRSLVYQNPDLLHAVLQQIGQTNPALLQLISENQDAFLNMLNQPVDGSDSGNNSSQRQNSPERRAQLNAAAVASLGSNIDFPGREQLAGDNNSSSTERTQAETVASNLASLGEERAIGDHPPTNPSHTGADGEGPAIIRLTRAEQDAIERLKAMGFPEALVLQAYFACDKDEQLAANFLISSAFED